MAIQAGNWASKLNRIVLTTVSHEYVGRWGELNWCLIAAWNPEVASDLVLVDALKLSGPDSVIMSNDAI